MTVAMRRWAAPIDRCTTGA